MSIATKPSDLESLSDRQIVSRYLERLLERRPGRGRPKRAKSDQEIAARVGVIDTEMGKASVLARLALTQERLELIAELEARAAPAPAEEDDRLEQAFIAAARRYSDERGISYGAWREMGVGVRVLRLAGIHS